MADGKQKSSEKSQELSKGKSKEKRRGIAVKSTSGRNRKVQRKSRPNESISGASLHFQVAARMERKSTYEVMLPGCRKKTCIALSGSKTDCAVPSCSTKTSEYKEYLTFVTMPKDPVRFRDWATLMGRSDILKLAGTKEGEDVVLCSQHFRPEMWGKSKSGQAKLLKSAVPSVFPDDVKKEPHDDDGMVTSDTLPETGATSTPIINSEVSAKNSGSGSLRPKRSAKRPKLWSGSDSEEASDILQGTNSDYSHSENESFSVPLKREETENQQNEGMAWGDSELWQQLQRELELTKNVCVQYLQETKPVNSTVKRRKLFESHVSRKKFQHAEKSSHPLSLLRQPGQESSCKTPPEQQNLPSACTSKMFSQVGRFTEATDFKNLHHLSFSSELKEINHKMRHSLKNCSNHSQTNKILEKNIPNPTRSINISKLKPLSKTVTPIQHQDTSRKAVSCPKDYKKVSSRKVNKKAKSCPGDSSYNAQFKFETITDYPSQNRTSQRIHFNTKPHNSSKPRKLLNGSCSTENYNPAAVHTKGASSSKQLKTKTINDNAAPSSITRSIQNADVDTSKHMAKHLSKNQKSKKPPVVKSLPGTSQGSLELKSKVKNKHYTLKNLRASKKLAQSPKHKISKVASKIIRFSRKKLKKSKVRTFSSIKILPNQRGFPVKDKRSKPRSVKAMKSNISSNFHKSGIKTDSATNESFTKNAQSKETSHTAIDDITSLQLKALPLDMTSSGLVKTAGVSTFSSTSKSDVTTQKKDLRKLKYSSDTPVIQTNMCQLKNLIHCNREESSSSQYRKSLQHAVLAPKMKRSAVIHNCPKNLRDFSTKHQKIEKILLTKINHLKDIHEQQVSYNNQVHKLMYRLKKHSKILEDQVKLHHNTIIQLNKSFSIALYDHKQLYLRLIKQHLERNTKLQKKILRLQDVIKSHKQKKSHTHPVLDLTKHFLFEQHTAYFTGQMLPSGSSMYSGNFKKFAIDIYKSSPHSYKILQTMFVLPTVERIKDWINKLQYSASESRELSCDN